MKKGKVINSDISRVIAQMGHFDKLSMGMQACLSPLVLKK